MDTQAIKQAYDFLYEGTDILSKALDISFIEAAFENLQNIADGSVLVREGQPEAMTVKVLDNLYQSQNFFQYDLTTRDEAIQLLLLQGMKRSEMPANAQMTPKAIALVLTFMIRTLTKQKQTIRLFDPVVGTGNLLHTVSGQLRASGLTVSAIGYDSDDLLLGLCEQWHRLLSLEVELYYGDVLRPLLLDPVDMVIADLPIGYYPDKTAKDRFTSAVVDQAHPMAYAHYLLIEQALTYLSPGGFAYFIVPSLMSEDPTYPKLVKTIHSLAYIQAQLALPASLFAKAAYQKSILILQKRGGLAKQHETVLLGDLPDLKDASHLKEFTESFSKWAQFLL